MGTKYEVTNAGIVKPLAQASDPAANEGGIYYNTASTVMRYHDGTTWVDFGSGGGGAGTLVIKDDFAAAVLNASLWSTILLAPTDTSAAVTASTNPESVIVSTSSSFVTAVNTGEATLRSIFNISGLNARLYYVITGQSTASTNVNDCTFSITDGTTTTDIFVVSFVSTGGSGIARGTGVEVIIDATTPSAVIVKRTFLAVNTVAEVTTSSTHDFSALTNILLQVKTRSTSQGSGTSASMQAKLSLCTLTGGSTGANTAIIGVNAEGQSSFGPTYDFIQGRMDISSGAAAISASAGCVACFKTCSPVYDFNRTGGVGGGSLSGMNGVFVSDTLDTNILRGYLYGTTSIVQGTSVNASFSVNGGTTTALLQSVLYGTIFALTNGVDYAVETRSQTGGAEPTPSSFSGMTLETDWTPPALGPTVGEIFVISRFNKTAGTYDALRLMHEVGNLVVAGSVRFKVWNATALSWETVLSKNSTGGSSGTMFAVKDIGLRVSTKYCDSGGFVYVLSSKNSPGVAGALQVVSTTQHGAFLDPQD